MAERTYGAGSGYQPTYSTTDGEPREWRVRLETLEAEVRDLAAAVRSLLIAAPADKEVYDRLAALESRAAPTEPAPSVRDEQEAQSGGSDSVSSNENLVGAAEFIESRIAEANRCCDTCGGNVSRYAAAVRAALRSAQQSPPPVQQEPVAWAVEVEGRVSAVRTTATAAHRYMDTLDEPSARIRPLVYAGAPSVQEEKSADEGDAADEFLANEIGRLAKQIKWLQSRNYELTQRCEAIETRLRGHPAPASAVPREQEEQEQAGERERLIKRLEGLSKYLGLHGYGQEVADAALAALRSPVSPSAAPDAGEQPEREPRYLEWCDRCGYERHLHPVSNSWPPLSRVRQHGAEAMSAERERLIGALTVMRPRVAALLTEAEANVIADALAALRLSEPQGERIEGMAYKNAAGDFRFYEMDPEPATDNWRPATLIVAPVESVRAPLTQNEDPIGMSEKAAVREVGFTPGPWRECGADRGGCQCRQVWSPGEDVIVAVALMNKNENFTGGAGINDLEIAKANARLIASAPEMYEALKDLVAIMPTVAASFYVPGHVREAARTALLKARGSNAGPRGGDE